LQTVDYICLMDLLQRDEKVIWHPFTQQKNRAPIIPIVSGKGSLLFDNKGNQYIDAISSWWVTLHGHAHPYIAEKIYQQALTLEQVIFAGFTHEPAIALAERLLIILPADYSKIFYSDNGSTSTEVAIKMAIQYWWNKGNRQRKKILAFNNSYHGDTFGAMSVSDRSVFTLAFQDLLFEVIFIDTPTQENISELKSIIHKEGNNIAAFIYEPLVQGAGGMKMYNPYLMNELLNTVKEASIICIADEVMTGFGRTGKFFASAYLNKKPDIICMSKGLTGGTMALGATACTNDIYMAYVEDDAMKTFFHGHSFTANPIACTAAMASLDLLEDPACISQIDWLSKSINEFAHSLNNHPGIKNVRCLGTILAFELNQGKDEYLNTISKEITQFCLENGIYLRPLGNSIYIMPPYCINNAELCSIFEVIHKILTKFSH
jgi:adenosylmethionine---8-amino-7-oxononanoate aminotransferase